MIMMMDAARRRISLLRDAQSLSDPLQQQPAQLHTRRVTLLWLHWA